MNKSEFLVTSRRGSHGKGRKGGSSVFARMFTVEGRREQLDEFAGTGEKNVLPTLKWLDGFEGLLVLANRQTGKILITSVERYDVVFSETEDNASLTPGPRVMALWVEGSGDRGRVRRRDIVSV